MEDFGFIIGLIKTYGYWVIAIGIFLECMGVPFPGETVLVLGAVAASMGHLSLPAVIILAAAAAILGDNMGYFVGKKFGRKILIVLHKLPFFHQKHVDYAENFFKKHGSKTVFLGRFTAILRTYSALFSGIFQMEYRTFFIYNLSGGILWATIFGLIGYAVGNNLGLLGQIITNLNIAAFIIVGALISFLLVRHFFFKRKTQSTVEPKIVSPAQVRQHTGLHLPTYKTAAPVMNPPPQPVQEQQ